MSKAEGTKWAPNDIHYDLIDGVHKGIHWVREAHKAAGIEFGKEILTSQDPRVQKAQELLKESGPDVPEGMAKWQLPVLFNDGTPTFMFVTVGAPNAVVPPHVHKELCIFRFIVSGSIIHRDVELKQGDWMYTPGGKGYTYTVGAMGVIILHKYVPL